MCFSVGECTEITTKKGKQMSRRDLVIADQEHEVCKGAGCSNVPLKAFVELVTTSKF